MTAPTSATDTAREVAGRDMRTRAMALIAQSWSERGFHESADTIASQDVWVVDVMLAFATTIAAEARADERERVKARLPADWCWDADDPEMPHDDPMEWFGYVAPGGREAIINRFQWAARLPDTWVLFVPPVDEDGDWTSQEFATAADAEVAAAAIRFTTENDHDAR